MAIIAIIIILLVQTYSGTKLFIEFLSCYQTKNHYFSQKSSFALEHDTLLELLLFHFKRTVPCGNIRLLGYVK